MTTEAGYLVLIQINSYFKTVRAAFLTILLQRPAFQRISEMFYLAARGHFKSFLAGNNGESTISVAPFVRELKVSCMEAVVRTMKALTKEQSR